MRTTIDIEDDVFLHARQVAAAEHASVGKVVSRLLRQALQGGAAGGAAASPYVFKNGIPVIPAAADGDLQARIVTQELIDRIRDEEGI